MSTAQLATMRYSQVPKSARVSKRPRCRYALSRLSCTTSSASCSLPVILNASRKALAAVAFDQQAKGVAVALAGSGQDGRDLLGGHLERLDECRRPVVRTSRKA